MKLRRLSLLWKIWLSTSVLLTVFFAATGWILQRRAAESTRHSLEEEVRASFQAYESVWRARQEMLGAVAKILSSLPNVRAAFGTGDQATIRDSASEIWQTISERLKQTAFFVVTDPRGATVAALGDRAPAGLPEIWTAVAAMRDKFPSQVAGFDVREGQLFHLVLTPVYVASSRGDALISVLVAGFPVHRQAAGELKGATGGSEFVFFSGGRIFASTLNEDATQTLTQALPRSSAGGVARAGAAEYYVETRLLPGLDGASVGSLGIFRSFEAARQRIATLRRDLIVIWLAAMGAGLALTYVLARLIVRPVEQLDHAAAQIARQNYDYRLNASVAESGDELGRLAATFNAMCDSLQRARSELIRQERISTIGRLTNSIVHDLRNPLAAIYGGA